MADSWEALKQDCAHCRGCALADTRTNVVFGDGAETAEIMLIGEGPGQHEDENSGQFTYFAFSPDTMETTYHLEFRYAEDLSDLQSWFEGNYAYWNAAAIAEDYDQATMENVIELFATENLSEAE